MCSAIITAAANEYGSVAKPYDEARFPTLVHDGWSATVADSRIVTTIRIHGTTAAETYVLI